MGDKGYWLYIYSVSDDRDTSYPNSGPFMDSKEGCPEESDERKADGTGEGGLFIDLGEGGRVRQILLPKHLGHDTGSLSGCSSKWGASLSPFSPDRLHVTGFFFLTLCLFFLTLCPLSVSWFFIYQNFQCFPSTNISVNNCSFVISVLVLLSTPTIGPGPVP